MKRIGLLAAFVVLGVLVWSLALNKKTSTTTQPPTSKENKKALVTLQPPKRDASIENKNVTQEDDPKGPLSLSGQVLDADGKPAPGATVSIDSNPARYATTDTRGWFFFEGLLGRVYYLEAKKDSAYIGPLSVDVNSITDPVELRLKNGSNLEILVLNEDTNQPLPNAKVIIEIITEYEAASDSSGVALFRGFGQNYATVYVAAPGYSQQRSSLEIKGLPNQTQKEVIYAKPGMGVSGVVVDPSGRPLPGAKVLATTISYDYVFLQDGDSAISDAEGKFEIGAVPAGGYRLYATHPEFRAALSDSFDVEPGVPSTGHSLQLEPGGVVAGKVVNQEDKPVPFAVVSLSYERLSMNTTEYWDYKKSSREVYCDATGAFSLEGVAPGKIELRSSAEELTEATVKITLQEGESKRDVLIVLDPGEEIAGRVVSDKGQPIEGAEVYSSKKIDPKEQIAMGYSYPRSISAKSNANGEFLLRGLEAGDYYINAYTAFDRSGPQYREEITPGQEQKSYPSGAKDVTLVLKRLDSVTVRGNVIFDEGGVPSSFMVRTGAKDGNFKDNSSFELENVVVEYAYMISIEGPEFRPVQRDLKLEVGKDVDLGTIKVKRGRTVEGQVVNARGTPVAGASVNVFADYSEETSSGTPAKPEDWQESFYSQKAASSDQNGRFVLHGISTKDNLIVSVDHPNKGNAKDTKIPKGTSNANVTITLQDGGIVVGKITRAGAPTRASISLIPESVEEQATGGYVPTSTSGGDGVYRMEHVPAGTYTADFFRYSDEQSYGESLVTKTITVRDGETVTLNIDLPVYPSLLVEVSGAKEEQGYWGFTMLKGSHKIKTNAQLEDVYAKLFEREGSSSSRGSSYYASDDFYTPGVQGKFIDVFPGAYTVCINFTPVQSDNVDGEFDYENYQKMPISCQSVQISQAPEQQSMTMSPP